MSWTRLNLITWHRTTKEAFGTFTFSFSCVALHCFYCFNSNRYSFVSFRSKDYVRRISEGSGNVDSSGNFSIEVLRRALLKQYNIFLPNIRQEKVMDGKDVTDIEGFICNRESHWFAIRKINGRFWNLNSTLEKPALISHFRLANEIKDLQIQGYSVFFAAETLPPTCSTKVGHSSGLPQYWWKESDLIAGKANATTGATNPWKAVGSGMRLDGHTARENSLEGMTEEEMLQMAMMASLEPETTPESVCKRVDIPPEPVENSDGIAKIQFRMPDGNRVLRRFMQDDSVDVVYGFVEQSSPGQMFELKYGFPLKDLELVRDMTIGQAKLNGENIQVRRV